MIRKSSKNPFDDGMTEDQLQVAIMRWWDAECEKYDAEPFDLMHIPNGLMSRKKIQFAKALGVRPGYPDLFLAIPKGEYGGLFIELKRPGIDIAKAVRSTQLEVLSRLRDVGYAAYALNSLEDVQEVISCYMKLETV